MRRFVTAVALVLALATSARADTLLASGVLIGTSGSILRCILVNLGTKPVPVTFMGVATADDGVVAPDTMSCTTLAPNAMCGFFSTLSVATAGGVMRVKGSAKTLRATCRMEKGDVIYATSEMR
jgi:hypothetical protein